jgi:small subunit ribosomal protein S16
MLAIRMQRTGRKGHPEFRVVVQDSSFTPTSGRIVARVGHHNPHSKETVLDIDKIVHYLSNGAQPSPRVVRLLQAEKNVTLPDWVKVASTDKAGKIKNAEKLRKNQPKEEKAEEPVAEAAPAEEPTEAEAEAPVVEEADVEVVAEEAAPEETPKETPAK